MMKSSSTEEEEKRDVARGHFLPRRKPVVMYILLAFMNYKACNEITP